MCDVIADNAASSGDQKLPNNRNIIRQGTGVVPANSITSNNNNITSAVPYVMNAIILQRQTTLSGPTPLFILSNECADIDLDDDRVQQLLTPCRPIDKFLFDVQPSSIVSSSAEFVDFNSPPLTNSIRYGRVSFALTRFMLPQRYASNQYLIESLTRQINREFKKHPDANALILKLHQCSNDLWRLIGSGSRSTKIHLYPMTSIQRLFDQFYKS
jgi:hypothetical protein